MDAALNDRVCSQPMMLNMHLYYKKWSLSYHNLNLSSFPFSAKIFFFSCTFLSLYTNNKCFLYLQVLEMEVEDRDDEENSRISQLLLHKEEAAAPTGLAV